MFECVVLVGVVIVGGWGLFVMFGLVGAFGGFWCRVGSLMVGSGSGVLGWWGRFCCWRVAGFHALHCWRLSCVWAVVVLVNWVYFLLLALVVFLFVGWDVVVVVAFVWVVFLCIFVLVVFSGFCFLEVGSSYAGCVGFIVSDVRFCMGRLRVVAGGGCGVLVVLFMSLIRWDLRCVMTGAWLGWRFDGGHGCVVSVLRSSFIICLILRSSSPVRANRR